MSERVGAALVLLKEEAVAFTSGRSWSRGHIKADVVPLERAGVDQDSGVRGDVLSPP